MVRTHLRRKNSTTSVFLPLQRFDFALLVFYVISLNLYLFTKNYLPRWDTAIAYEIFNYFYNEFFFYGDLAQWMPYYSFGMPSSYWQIYALSPLSYFLMFIGRIFEIKDAFLLFKLLFFVEQIVLLLGTYLLSRLLFVRRSTVFFVCLAVSSGVCWTNNIFADFRMFYMFPWVAYFLVLFFQQKKAEYFWGSGISAIVWFIGNTHYFICLWFFTFAIMFAVFSVYDRTIWRSLFQPTPRSLTLMLVFTVLCFSVFYPIQQFLSFSDLFSRGQGGRNSLGIFLTYGGEFGSLENLSKGFLLGNDIKSYVGLLPLALFLWSLIKVRSAIFMVFLSATVALFWLSFSGILSAAVYFFPGMAYYRHIGFGFIYSLIKILVVLCAGFGLENFWSATPRTKIVVLSLISAGFLFLLDATGVPRQALAALSLSDHPFNDLISQFHFGSSMLRIVLYVAAVCFVLALLLWDYFQKKRSPPSLLKELTEKIAPIALILFFLLDILSARSLNQPIKGVLEKGDPFLQNLTVSELKFQPQRLEAPQEPRQQEVFEKIARNMGFQYAIVYSFLQFDPCLPQFRTDFRPQGVSRLLKIAEEDPKKDISRILGCRTPKLRFVPKAVFLETTPQIVDAVKDLSNTFETVVLRGMPPDDGTVSQNISAYDVAASKIDVRKFNANELAADVVLEKNTWLVYADSFHPGWHAAVDGKRTPLYEANLAFKAVFLEKGQHTVRFYFQNGVNTFLSYFIAMFGAIVSIGFIALFLRVLLNKWGGRLFL